MELVHRSIEHMTKPDMCCCGMAAANNVNNNFCHVTNRMVETMELKKISLEGVTFILNNSDYLSMAPWSSSNIVVQTPMKFLQTPLV